MDYIGLNDLNQLAILSEACLVNKINEIDERKWNEEMANMSTLNTYRQFKNEIKQEMFYDNTWESVLLFRARSNSLQLDWRRRFLGGETRCKLCNSEDEETLEHFVLHCKFYENLRNEYDMNNKSVAQILILDEGCDLNVSKNYLGELWKRRRNNIVEN